MSPAHANALRHEGNALKLRLCAVDAAFQLGNDLNARCETLQMTTNHAVGLHLRQFRVCIRIGTDESSGRARNSDLSAC